MTLSIFSSNRVELLQQNLCRHLSQATLADPLASEIIVVPTYAVARWLNLKIAQQQGIAANFEYPLPADWVWQTAASVLTQGAQSLPSSASCPVRLTRAFAMGAPVLWALTTPWIRISRRSARCSVIGESGVTSLRSTDAVRWACP